ncbi:MAG: dipeptidase [Candidatus Promineifilaceae bacterium]
MSPAAMLIVDAHLDLAYNALVHGRNLRAPLAEVRAAEAGREETGRIGTATVSLPELRAAGVALVFGTLFVAPAGSEELARERPFSYRTPEEAHRLAQEQLDFYHRLADEVEYVRLVTGLAGLEAVLKSHEGEGPGLLGIMPLMEGADPVRRPAELEQWHERGLRAIGPAWDDTRYAPGAWKAGGPLTAAGRKLLNSMADFHLILDLTHMAEQASLEALDRYPGPVMSSHANARALVPTNRQLSDIQIRRIAERDGVLGIVLANGFLKEGHKRADPKQNVTLQHVADHIDHFCQLIGDAGHVGIGSDFDGGFGREHVPAGVDAPADLLQLAPVLRERGYSQADAAGILGGNWIAFLRRAWAAG